MRSYFIQLDLDGRAEYIWNSVSILDLMNRGISRPNDQVKCCLTTLGSRSIVEVGECYNPKRICTWEFVRNFYGSSGKSLPSSVAGSSAMARMLGSIIPGSEYHAIPYRVGLLLSDLVVLWNANTHFRYCGGGSTTILEEEWFGTILFAMTCFILRLAQWGLGVQVTIEMNNPSWTLLLLWISILVIPPLVILALRVYFRARSSFTPNQFSHQRLEGSNSIRLSRVHRKPVFGDSVISCDMIHANLNRTPPYRAIPYTWGNPKHNEQILIDGEFHTVFPNVYSILQGKRSFWSNRMFWIDSICIN